MENKTVGIISLILSIPLLFIYIYAVYDCQAFAWEGCRYLLTSSIGSVFMGIAGLILLIFSIYKFKK